MRVTSRYSALDDSASRVLGDELLAWLRDYGDRRVNSRLIDERRCIPPHVVLDWGNRGLLGMQVETRFGGLALRNREIARVLEQAAALDLGLGTWLLTSLFPGVRPIAAFGGDALKARVLPDLARGRVLAGYAQTEPDAGTHFAAMAARAVQRPGGGWSVSGDKIWIGNASWAGILNVMAYEFEPGGKRVGLLPLAVPTDLPGVRLGAELLSLGMRGMVQNEIAFRDVAVDVSHRLGEPNQGLDVGVDSMSFSRFAIAATCVGAMKRAVQLMLRFASRRSIATGALLEHPVALEALSEAVFKIAASEALLYEIADVLDAGEAAPVELFAACKVAASEFAWQTSDRLVQLLGSRGYDEANGASQLLRDARVTRIFEGTTEALLAFLGAQALNPRSDLHTFLAERLRAEALVGELGEALGAMRRRPGADGAALVRPAQHALAGQAAVWALLTAALERHASGDDADAARSFARARFDEALARAAGGDGEMPTLAPIALEKVVEGYAQAIGDPEQSLPGEKLELDPLLRRAPRARFGS
jgi:alkylation response protein AidB-like acyl-CoA dehydrogenase